METPLRQRILAFGAAMWQSVNSRQFWCQSRRIETGGRAVYPCLSASDIPTRRVNERYPNPMRLRVCAASFQKCATLEIPSSPLPATFIEVNDGFCRKHREKMSIQPKLVLRPILELLLYAAGKHGIFGLFRLLRLSRSKTCAANCQTPKGPPRCRDCYLSSPH